MVDDLDLWYFAYGSNMNQQRMIDRKVGFTDRQVAKLDGYKFKLNMSLGEGFTAANICQTDGEHVYGVLYRCNEKGLSTLDIFEEVDNGLYERRKVFVELSDGTKAEATTYVALVTDDSLHKVSAHYLHHILEGRDILPNEYVEWLEKEFRDWCVDTPCNH